MKENKEVEILYDHYKDTFENQKGYLKKRNFYTLGCLVLIGLLSFVITNPEDSGKISEVLISDKFGKISIDFSFINNILTFSLLWVVIMYYQIIFLIEKTYKYVHEMEDKLTSLLEPIQISREGKSYLSHKPWLTSVVVKVYTVGFPFALILIAFFKLRTEYTALTCPCENGNFWFDAVCLFGVIVTSFLYLINCHFNDFRPSK